ncbi:MAG: heterodisulfide reductase-related iron-sulfur binding cluster [Steroidobacteraceae bacterium]
MSPTREVYFNIEGASALYAFAVVAFAVFGFGVWRRVRAWRRGRGVSRGDQPGRRLQALFRGAALHERLLARYRGAGLFHLGIFWGFVLLLAGTTVVFVHEDLGLRIMQGAFYLYFQSLVLDLAGALFLVAVVAASVHRYVRRPQRLAPARAHDVLALAFLFVILVTGFLIEGARIRLTGDPWAAWSPVGNGVGGLLAGVLDPGGLRGLHRGLWWFHLVIVLSFIAWLPYSKLLHAVTAPANLYLQDLGPKGALRPLELRAVGPLGAGTLPEFTWKDLLDLDACTECGRCEDQCPATASGKPLSPKKLILNLQALQRRSGADGGAPLDTAVTDAELWACTTCRACTEACPVMIEHVDKVVEMRRHRVLEEGRFPAEYRTVFRNLEVYGDPLGRGRARREEWATGMKVERVRDGAPVDVLFWTGCMGALYDERSRQTVAAAARVLDKAGVRYAILGREESCCGDPARRMGNEYLFQQFAGRNIETFKRHGVRRIVTQCPHCFNTLKNEYAAFGADLEVTHIAELGARLIREGQLQPKAKPTEGLTYHDPCYLGRHNAVYDEPRAVLQGMLERPIAEMPRSREKSACCGAGGGNVWCGTSIGQRIEEQRIEEAMATAADGVVTSCPFCEIMLDSAAKQKGLGQSFRVLDVVEVLDRAT